MALPVCIFDFRFPKFRVTLYNFSLLAHPVYRSAILDTEIDWVTLYIFYFWATLYMWILRSAILDTEINF